MGKLIRYKGELMPRREFLSKIARIAGKKNKGRPRPDLMKGGKNYANIVAGIRRRYKPKSLQDRLDEHVLINIINGCHEWCGAKAGAGYGYYSIRSEKGIKNQYIHRAVYERKYGAIPKGKIVMHKCDNPCCCNIDHLILGTMSDNTKDMISKNRHPAHMTKSELNKNRKLTRKQVEDIISEKTTSRECALKYNVHHSTISRIRLNNGY